MTQQFFAQLDDNNVVIRVAVVQRQFLEANPQRYPGRWVETFHNVSGKTYAGVDWIYDEETEDFKAPSFPNPLEP